MIKSTFIKIDLGFRQEPVACLSMFCLLCIDLTSIPLNASLSVLSFFSTFYGKTKPAFPKIIHFQNIWFQPCESQTVQPYKNRGAAYTIISFNIAVVLCCDDVVHTLFTLSSCHAVGHVVFSCCHLMPSGSICQGYYFLALYKVVDYFHLILWLMSEQQYFIIFLTASYLLFAVWSLA